MQQIGLPGGHQRDWPDAACKRLHRLEQQLTRIAPNWSMAPLAEATRRAQGPLVAVTFAAEIGDVRRFDTSRQLMSFLSLVPAESLTGDARRRMVSPSLQSPAPKSGAGQLPGPTAIRQGRRDLEGPARRAPLRGARYCPAQIRLCTGYRRLSGAGKKLPVVVAAIAREIAAFLVGDRPRGGARIIPTRIDTATKQELHRGGRTSSRRCGWDGEPQCSLCDPGRHPFGIRPSAERDVGSAPG